MDVSHKKFISEEIWNKLSSEIADKSGYQFFLDNVCKIIYGRLLRHLPKSNNKNAYMHSLLSYWNTFIDFRHKIDFCIFIQNLLQEKRDWVYYREFITYFLESVYAITLNFDKYNLLFENLFNITKFKKEIANNIICLKAFFTLRKILIHPCDIKITDRDKKSYEHNKIFNILNEIFFWESKNLKLKDNYLYLKDADIFSLDKKGKMILTLNNQIEISFNYYDLINNFFNKFFKIIKKYNSLFLNIKLNPFGYYQPFLDIKRTHYNKRMETKFQEIYVNDVKNPNKNYFCLKIFYLYKDYWKNKKKEITLQWFEYSCENNNFKKFKELKKGINWAHKGARLGKIIANYIPINSGIIFHDCLATDHSFYDRQQPDGLLLNLFFIFCCKHNIVNNYRLMLKDFFNQDLLTYYWFVALIGWNFMANEQLYEYPIKNQKNKILKWNQDHANIIFKNQNIQKSVFRFLNDCSPIDRDLKPFNWLK